MHRSNVSYDNTFWDYLSLRADEKRRFKTPILKHYCPASCGAHTPQVTDVYQNAGNDRIYMVRNTGWDTPIWGAFARIICRERR